MSRPPVTRAELEAAIGYARAVGAPSWLIALLERELAEMDWKDARAVRPHDQARERGV